MSLDRLNRIKSYLCTVMPKQEHDITIKGTSGKYTILFHGFKGEGTSLDLAAEDCLNQLVFICLQSHLLFCSEPSENHGQNG